jgi:hypothetical protein
MTSVLCSCNCLFPSVHPSLFSLSIYLSLSLSLYIYMSASTTHGKIANEAEGLQLSQTVAQRAGAAPRDDDVILMTTRGRENHLHTPPMLFPHDSLKLAHYPRQVESEGSGAGAAAPGGLRVEVAFNVLDAMSCWAVQHRADEHAACIPEVPYAHKWQPQPPPMPPKPPEEGTTSDTSTNNSASCSGGRGSGEEGKSGAEGLPDIDIAPMQCQSWDWTYR